MAQDESLRRLGGGRWQTRDERFTIESESGRWSVVDAERTDELGLPLVRGPFGSLTEAKGALEGARAEAGEASPLAKRIAAAKERTARDETDRPREARRGERANAGRSKAPPARSEPPEPMWLAALDKDDRARAKRLIEALSGLDIPDPERLVREDLGGEAPTVARAVLLRRLAILAEESAGKDATDAERLASARVVGAVAEWLTNRGREPGPRLALPGWRLVEDGGSDRRIAISRADVERAVKRAERD